MVVKQSPCHLFFGKYNLFPSFICNAWTNMLVLCCLFLFLLSLKLIEAFTKGHRIIQVVRISFQNFMLSQIYGVLGDNLLFSILEYQTFTFGFNLSLLSISLSTLFMILTFGCLIFHIKLLLKYHQILQKTKQLPDQRKMQLEQFHKNHAGYKVLFEDFKDTDFLKQGFLLFLTIRDLLMSLILATLFAYPIVQVFLILILNVWMIIYLFTQRPFQDRFLGYQQIFFEFMGLGVHISVLIVSALDNQNNRAFGTRNNVGKYIIYSNMVFNLSAVLFMLIVIILQIYPFCKMFYQNKIRKPSSSIAPVYPSQRNRDTIDTTTNITQNESETTEKVRFNNSIQANQSSNTNETISFGFEESSIQEKDQIPTLQSSDFKDNNQISPSVLQRKKKTVRRPLGGKSQSTHQVHPFILSKLRNPINSDLLIECRLEPSEFNQT